MITYLSTKRQHVQVVSGHGCNTGGRLAHQRLPTDVVPLVARRSAAGNARRSTAAPTSWSPSSARRHWRVITGELGRRLRRLPCVSVCVHQPAIVTRPSGSSCPETEGRRWCRWPAGHTLVVAIEGVPSENVPPTRLLCRRLDLPRPPRTSPGQLDGPRTRHTGGGRHGHVRRSRLTSTCPRADPLRVIARLESAPAGSWR
jgi:hypothetical protein